MSERLEESRQVSAQEMEAQREYQARVRELVEQRYVEQPLACVRVYGCQQNVSDGERIKGMLREMGFGFTDEVDEAELVLYNTCAVRGHAEDRVIGNVGALKHYKRRKPGAIVGLCGCMVQQEQVANYIRKTFPFVNLVFGTHVIYRLPEFLFRLYSGQKRVFELPDEKGRIAEGIPVRRDSAMKGWLPIMYGCDNFCTYCIVPYVRGRERSRESSAILQEARELIASGCREITLLGQNVNSYGKGLEESIDFARLLRMLNDLPGDFRLRFMTSHPKDCTPELLDAMRDCEKVARHLHLPVQSGSDRVLRAMNRKYTRAQYLSLVEQARERMPDLSLTSDIIVGFPGETREDFEDTLSLVKEVGYTALFTFLFSPREGTPAASMPDPISKEEKDVWFAELLAAQEKIVLQNNAALHGMKFRVLCEEEGREPGIVVGRTSQNTVVEFPGKPSLLGSYCDITITGNRRMTLLGEQIIS